MKETIIVHTLKKISVEGGLKGLTISKKLKSNASKIARLIPYERIENVRESFREIAKVK